MKKSDLLIFAISVPRGGCQSIAIRYIYIDIYPRLICMLCVVNSPLYPFLCFTNCSSLSPAFRNTNSRKRKRKKKIEKKGWPNESYMGLKRRFVRTCREQGSEHRRIGAAWRRVSCMWVARSVPVCTNIKRDERGPTLATHACVARILFPSLLLAHPTHTNTHVFLGRKANWRARSIIVTLPPPFCPSSFLI